MSLISAITSRGHMRFMIKEKGGVNAAVFIEFLAHDCWCQAANLFDRRSWTSPHRQEDQSFCREPEGQTSAVLSSTLSPDRNPDELVWKHLKADTVGRMAITNKADFKAKVRTSMRQLQNDPEKIRSFYQKPSLKYAA